MSCGEGDSPVIGNVGVEVIIGWPWRDCHGGLHLCCGSSAAGREYAGPAMESELLGGGIVDQGERVEFSTRIAFAPKCVISAGKPALLKYGFSIAI